MPQQNAIVFDWLNGAEDIDKVEAFYKFRISSEHSPQNSAIFSYQFQLEYFPSYCLKKWKRSAFFDLFFVKILLDHLRSKFDKMVLSTNFI